MFIERMTDKCLVAPLGAQYVSLLPERRKPWLCLIGYKYVTPPE